jgi:hypothetical protein
MEEIDPHPLLSHPEASRLVTLLEKWIREDAVGADATDAFAEMRRTAIRMLTTQAEPPALPG